MVELAAFPKQIPQLPSRLRRVCLLCRNGIRYGLLAFALMLICQTVAPANASAPDAKKDLERIAGKLSFLLDSEIFYNFSLNQFDRTYEFQFSKKRAAEHRKLILELTTSPYDVNELLELLKHNNSRVRALAIAALFNKGDPSLLPHIAAMAEDKARTFPYPEFCTNHPALTTFEAQTVGDLANKFVSYYLSTAGYERVIEKTTDYGGFEDYWSSRKDRTFCASWFAVQLQRATGVITPSPDDCIPRIRAVRKRIDRLPELDRAWTLLWLHQPEHGDVLVSDAECIDLCKKLGPERLMLMLRGKAPSDDPDIHSPPNPYNFSRDRMMQFVLMHATALLRKQDADALAADESQGVWRTIAAADLYADAQKANDILSKGLRRYTGRFHDNDRRLLLHAMLRLGGPTATRDIVAWFYEARAQDGEAAVAVCLLGDRQLLANIVRDKRFKDADNASLAAICDCVNDWAKQTVVEPQLIADIRVPPFIRNLELAEIRKQIDDRKSKARALVIESIPQWSKVKRAPRLLQASSCFRVGRFC